MMLMWLVMNLVIPHMVCLIAKLYAKGLHSIIPVGNIYEKGWTDEKYPIIITGFDCSGSDTRLSSCSPSVNSNIQYCSNNEVINLSCEGQYYLKYCIYKIENYFVNLNTNYSSVQSYFKVTLYS